MVYGPSRAWGSQSPDFQPVHSKTDQAIINQMEEFEKELRADMGPPPNTKKLKELLVRMENFLENNKQAIYNILQKNGFPDKGPFSISAEFDTAISCIQNFLADPNNTKSLILLNESITQLNFYANHLNK